MFHYSIVLLDGNREVPAGDYSVAAETPLEAYIEVYNKVLEITDQPFLLRET